MSIFDSITKPDAPARRMPPALTRAFAVLRNSDPFMSAFASGLNFRPSSAVWCMATDCVSTILYNPDTIEKTPHVWTAEMLACVIAHECMHILRDDGALALQLPEHDLANIAMDSCINRDLLESGWTWPAARWAHPLNDNVPTANPGDETGATGKVTLYASDNKFETTRMLYRKLKERRGKEKKQGGGGQGKQHAGAAADVDVKAYRDAIKQAGGADAARDMVRGMAEQAAREAQGESGIGESASAGDAPTVQSSGGSGWSLEKSAAAREIESMGIVIKSPRARLLRTAGARVRGIMRARTRRASTMLVPSPLSEDMGRLMTGKRRARDIRPGVLLDASGSISDAQLKLQAAAANVWVRQFVPRGVRVPAAAFCERIVDSGYVDKFRPGYKVQGAGGGTDFRAALAWAENKGLTHLLVFTDACGPWPAAAPSGVRVIVVLPEPYMRSAIPFKVDRVKLDV